MARRSKERQARIGIGGRRVRDGQGDWSPDQALDLCGGKRSRPPTFSHGIPPLPPLSMYSRARAYAVVRPTRKIAITSMMVRK